MSARSELAEKIGKELIELGLNEVYGVMVGKSNEGGKPHYSINFCQARYTDGVVKVYSPKFILVKWQTAFRDMPNRGQEKFDNEESAINFIKASFVRNQKATA